MVVYYLGLGTDGWRKRDVGGELRIVKAGSGVRQGIWWSAILDDGVGLMRDGWTGKARGMEQIGCIIGCRMRDSIASGCRCLTEDSRCVR